MVNCKRIFVILFLGAIILLTCFASEEKELYAEMPDIVFVKFYWDYNDVITGEYIDRNGQVTGFEFKGAELMPMLEESSSVLEDVKSIGQYPEVRDIHTINRLIYDHYYENNDRKIIKTVSENKMAEYYNELLRVDEGFWMDTDGYTITNDLQGLSCMYGIRNSGEVIFIREYGKYYLTTAEKHTDNLFRSFHTVFSQMMPMINGW